jgi:hypothetical protein
MVPSCTCAVAADWECACTRVVDRCLGHLYWQRRVARRRQDCQPVALRMSDQRGEQNLGSQYLCPAPYFVGTCIIRTPYHWAVRNRAPVQAGGVLAQPDFSQAISVSSKTRAFMIILHCQMFKIGVLSFFVDQGNGLVMSQAN